jgi:hypothetical protein
MGPGRMNADHVLIAAVSAVCDWEHNAVEPEHRGRYGDAFGWLEVRPYRGHYRVSGAFGAYVTALEG